MPSKIRLYDVDQAVCNNRPQVRLRGILYSINDLTMADRLASMLKTQMEQEALEASGDDPDKLREAVNKLAGRMVQQMLDGVPDEVAHSITEREFKAISNAIAHARNLDVPIEGKDVEDPGQGSKLPTVAD